MCLLDRKFHSSWQQSILAAPSELELGWLVDPTNMVLLTELPTAIEDAVRCGSGFCTPKRFQKSLAQPTSRSAWSAAA